MVRIVRLCAVTLLAALALTGCEIFTTTPFPGFVDKTDISIDLGPQIDAIAAGQGISSYDLQVVTSAGRQPRVLLLAEPPSSDPTVGFKYTGKIIFMDQDLNVLSVVGTQTEQDYFSKPYAYGHDGTLLAGYTGISSAGVRLGMLSRSGLEGFAFTDGTDTYLFAIPSGQYTSFELSDIGYTNPWVWTYSFLETVRTLSIIAPGSQPSSSDPNYANLGYQLVGLSYDPATTNVTFIFSKPSTGQIMAARTDLATATTVGAVLLPDESSWPVSMTVDRPDVHADALGFFLVRRDGWMERYTWKTSGPLALEGDPVRIVGDRSLSRKYAFLVDQTGSTPSYMYRFDPSSRVLTRYRRWW